MATKDKDKATAADQEVYNPGRANEDTSTPISDTENKDGEFRPIEKFSDDYDKAVEASKDVQEQAREELPFTKEGAEKAAEKLENAQAISRVVGYTTHPDTPVKVTPEPVTPSLNDAEAKAKALNVPVGAV